MIKKYTFGKPITTGSTVMQFNEAGDFPAIIKTQEDGFIINLDKDDVIYGLGESVRGINKRGFLYKSWCSDDPDHNEEKNSLYGAHNFIIISGKEKIGLFFDYPGQITYDAGFTNNSVLHIILETMDFYMYVITAKDEKEIVSEFRNLTGESYIPPLWAFGYGQSRWGYKNHEDLDEVLANYRREDIPIDSIYMDIDYMDHYKDFTLNDEAFPDFENYVNHMSEEGIHLVPIIDAGVKIEKDYDIYEEGVENNYFCKDEEGNNFVAGVWPGKVHFPDFLDPEAAKWFGMKYKYLTDKGIDGFWNDMNEPAMFYSEKHLNEVFAKLKEMDDKELDIDGFFALSDLIRGIANNMQDYQSFYHNFNGEKVRHDKVHNLFGYYMTKAASDAFKNISPNKRILMFSRASAIGMHRYAGIWTGDNKSMWSHLLMNIQMMPSLNMCGFLFSGADTGGFGSNCTSDLMARWLAFSIFTPLFRNHSAIGTRDQELYRFDNCHELGELVKLRYRFLPYLYSEFVKAVKNNAMLFRPLAFDYPDDKDAKACQDQVMFGEGLMLAPVYTQNADGRHVYLPDNMLMVRFSDSEHYECTHCQKGHNYFYIAENEVVFFIKPEKVFVMCNGGKNTRDTDLRDLHIINNATKSISYDYYTDDGYTRNINMESNVIKINIDADNNIDTNTNKLTVKSEKF